MRQQIVSSTDRKKILSYLKETYGIDNLPYLLVESGKQKIRGFSGSLSKEDLIKLADIANVEIIGIYLLKQEKEGDVRIGFDSTHLLKDEIKESITELDDEKANLWLKGNDLELPIKHGNTVIKHNSDFLGCGKSNGKIIYNYVPKDRRLRK